MEILKKWKPEILKKRKPEIKEKNENIEKIEFFSKNAF